MIETIIMMRITAMHEEIYEINQKAQSKDLIRFELCGTTFPDKSYRIKRDNSCINCIEYVEAGSGTVHLDATTFHPSGGDAYFLQAKKNQHYYADRGDPWKKYFINFSGTLADSLAEGYGLSNQSYFEGLDIKNELCRIIEIGKLKDGDHTAELIGILNDILFKMRAHQKKNCDRVGIEYEMKDYLNTQITAKFKMEHLCKQVSRSESQTIRIFKKTFGVTPYAYLLSKKIEFSKRLLENTNLSISQIADKLCFADEYYFSNAFKSRVGIAPTLYRKEALNGNSKKE